MTTPEQSSELPDEPAFEFELDELSPLTEAVLRYEHAKSAASETLQTFFKGPVETEIVNQLGSDYQQISGFYNNCIKAINEEPDTDTDTKISMITTLTVSESRERIKAFEELYPGHKKLFKPYKVKDVRNNIEQIYEKYESEKKRRKVLNELFNGSLVTQLNSMLQLKDQLPSIQEEPDETIQENEYEMPPAPQEKKYKETLRVFGKYALEITKVGVGVAAGIVAASLITKRR